MIPLGGSGWLQVAISSFGLSVTLLMLKSLGCVGTVGKYVLYKRAASIIKQV